VVAVEQFVRSYLVLATTTNHKKGKTHLPQTRARRILPGVSQLVFSILHFADKVTFTGCSFMLQTQKKKRGRARNGCVKIGVDGYWVMPAVLYNNTIPALPHCTPSPA
jgi:hypothetical protein